MLLRTILTAGAIGLLSTASYAGCGIDSGSVRIGGNDFPAYQAVTKAAASCSGDGVTVTIDLNKDHKDRQVASLTANPAEFTSSIANNSALVALMNDGLVQPLNNLIARHGSGLQDMQIVSIDGEVMAIAFMANAQHLFYRSDILDAAGVAPPKTYEEVLAAAKAIKSKGLMEHPIAGTYAGWNLGLEFINMYLGHSGEFFESGSAKPAINNAKGIATLNMMKSLTEYMNPDFLTYDSNAVQADWEAGKVALTNLWGSRAGSLTDGEGSTAEIESNTKFASAPSVAGGSVPSTTLWWDGFTVAKNTSAEDATATFIAMMNGITPAMASANPNDANWLISGSKPLPTGVGVVASAQGGALPYPMLPYMGAMHNAIGSEIVDFLQGNETAEKALADVEAAYIAAATEKGFL
jgi:ABC-type glycerol-3-phosphate transport system substrate-binding protein